MVVCREAAGNVFMLPYLDCPYALPGKVSWSSNLLRRKPVAVDGARPYLPLQSSMCLGLCWKCCTGAWMGSYTSHLQAYSSSSSHQPHQPHHPIMHSITTSTAHRSQPSDVINLHVLQTFPFFVDKSLDSASLADGQTTIDLQHGPRQATGDWSPESGQYCPRSNGAVLSGLDLVWTSIWPSSLKLCRSRAPRRRQHFGSGCARGICAEFWPSL